MVSKKITEKNRLIGSILQDARYSKKITQAQMAEIAHYTKNHISAIERGVVRASVSTLITYCHALDMTPDEILSIDPRYQSYEQLFESMEILDYEDKKKSGKIPSDEETKQAIAQSVTNERLRVYKECLSRGMDESDAREISGIKKSGLKR